MKLAPVVVCIDMHFVCRFCGDVALALLLVRDFFCAKIPFLNTVGKIHPFKNSEKLEIKFYKTSIV